MIHHKERVSRKLGWLLASLGLLSGITLVVVGITSEYGVLTISGLVVGAISLTYPLALFFSIKQVEEFFEAINNIHP